jgi:hypothetical protein
MSAVMRDHATAFNVKRAMGGRDAPTRGAVLRAAARRMYRNADIISAPPSSQVN